MNKNVNVQKAEISESSSMTALNFFLTEHVNIRVFLYDIDITPMIGRNLV